MRYILNENKCLMVFIQKPKLNGFLTLYLSENEDKKLIVLISDNFLRDVRIDFDTLEFEAETFNPAKRDYSSECPCFHLLNSKHLHIILSDENDQQEIIIDNAIQDIRFKSGTRLLKLRYYKEAITTIY